MSFIKDVTLLSEKFPFDMFFATGEMLNPPVLHFHDFLEINFIEGGSGINIIGDKKYVITPGDFYIINNLERHIGVSDGTLKIMVIVFNPTFIFQNNPLDFGYLKSFFNRGVHFSNKVDKNDEYYDELESIKSKLYKEWNNKNEGYRLIIKALLMNLLAILYRHFKANDEILDESPAVKSYERINLVLDYINLNFTKELQLDELAHIAFMSRTYFSTCFKASMNMNIAKYIDLLRINRACMYLKTTNKSVTIIAYEIGFNSISYFNKVFKKYMKLTPTRYREESE